MGGVEPKGGDNHSSGRPTQTRRLSDLVGDSRYQGPEQRSQTPLEALKLRPTRYGVHCASGGGYTKRAASAVLAVYSLTAALASFRARRFDLGSCPLPTYPRMQKRLRRNGEPEVPVNDRHGYLFGRQVDHAGPFFDHPERRINGTRSLNGHHPCRLRQAVARASIVWHVHVAVLHTPPTPLTVDPRSAKPAFGVQRRGEMSACRHDG
jgi:hypothetical protein